MGKPTVHDIAKEAGVSLATVDRVLNARPGVREKTTKRVQAAIERLGYVRDMTAANLARQRRYRMAFVLPEAGGQFVTTIRAALAEAATSQLADRTDLKILPIPSHDPHAVGRTLQAIDPSRFDGVAVMAPETPQTRDAVARLKAANLAVVALVSDLPNSGRDHFVGIDNHAAGATAARLMGRFLAPGRQKILVVASSMQARDSLDRRLGFDQIILRDYSHLDVLPTIEAHDDPDRMEAVVRAAFATHAAIGGVYSLSSGNERLIETLQSLAPPARPVMIAHELTPVTRAGLMTGMLDAIITQNVGHLARSALRILRAKCDGLDIIESQERIRIEIVLKENLP